MAVKTITIDAEAYGLLAADKRGGESFSKVIKRRLAPKTARRLLENLDKIALSEKTIEHVNRVVQDRRRNMARSHKL